jgi:hypothetical protein
MTGSSSYSTLSSLGSAFRSLTNVGGIFDYSLAGVISSLIGGSSSGYSSSYNWNYVTKGLSRALGTSATGSGVYVPGTISTSSTDDLTNTSSQSAVSTKSTSNIIDYLNTMESFVAANKSYDEWVKSASNYGISDLSAALTTYGISDAELEGKYGEYEAAKSTEYDYNQDAMQQEFWNIIETFVQEDFPSMFDEIVSRLDTQIEFMTSIDATLTSFFGSWTDDWLAQAWPIDWIQNAWKTDWLQNGWYTAWLAKSWNTDWLKEAWQNNWLDNAWQTNWLDDAWYGAWLDEAWKNSWLTDAWGTQWLQNAWNTDWLQNAWQTNWIENAWAQKWIKEAWNTNWLETAWATNWLKEAWDQNWLKTAWEQNWLGQAWSKDWISDNWKTAWLSQAWNTDWLKGAWSSEWLSNNWATKWLQNAWNKTWIKETWKENWVDKAFNKNFVNDIVKVLWGNRWWDFFNIFKDRFGGISTADTDTGVSGKTTVDTSGLYKIYTQETGKAAANALKEVANEESTETGDAVLALAKQLTKNSVELKDPQVQTNVLLSQILIVLEAIMQAENTAGGASLATTLAALGLGTTTSNISNSAGTSSNRVTTV